MPDLNVLYVNWWCRLHRRGIRRRSSVNADINETSAWLRSMAAMSESPDIARIAQFRAMDAKNRGRRA